jgi:hypothetical protein
MLICGKSHGQKKKNHQNKRERRVNLLVYSLSLHRHSYIGFILAFASSIHNNKRQKGVVLMQVQVLSLALALSIHNKQTAELTLLSI